MAKRLGLYGGTPVYECTKEEYEKLNGKFPDIYVIDGLMIQGGKIFATFDGYDVYELKGSLFNGCCDLDTVKGSLKVPYLYEEFEYNCCGNGLVNRIEKHAVQGEGSDEPETAGSLSTGIDYSEYSIVVDDFFSNLKDPEIEISCE